MRVVKAIGWCVVAAGFAWLCTFDSPLPHTQVVTPPVAVFQLGE